MQRGDTVSAIAARFGLRTADVLALNGLGWSSIIYPGQVLRLVGTPRPRRAPAPARRRGAGRGIRHLHRSGRRHDQRDRAAPRRLDPGGASPRTASAGRRSSTPARTSRSRAAAPAPRRARGARGPPRPPRRRSAPAAAYTVEAGDTISSIASRHGVSTQAVLERERARLVVDHLPGPDDRDPAAAPRLPRAVVRSPASTPSRSRTRSIIVQVGRELGVPDRGIAIALGTAMQESWHAQPRLGRPRLARPLPAAPEHGLGHRRRGARSGAGRAGLLRRPVRPERRRTPAGCSTSRAGRA